MRLLCAGPTAGAEISAELPEDTNPAVLYLREFLMLPDSEETSAGEQFRRGLADDEARAFLESNRFEDRFQRLMIVRSLTGVCDWGDDLSQGPYLLLPHLSPARELAYAAALQARVSLADGSMERAVEGLLVADRLAADVASTPILINLLVSYAIEGILTNVLSEDLGAWDEDSLRDLALGLMDRPEKKTVADAVDVEEVSMLGWMERRILNIRTEFSDDVAAQEKVLAGELKELFEMSSGTLEDEALDSSDAVLEMLELINEAKPAYRELKRLCLLPLSEALPAVRKFEEEVISGSDNMILRLVMPSISRVVVVAMESQLRRAMLLAAIDVHLSGAGALERHKDPLTGEPFVREPFLHEGSEIGFTLESRIEGDLDKRRLFIVNPVDVRFQLVGDELGSPESAD